MKKPFVRIGAHPSTSPARSTPRSAPSTRRPASARAATTPVLRPRRAEPPAPRAGRTTTASATTASTRPSRLLGTLGTFTTAPSHKAPFTFTAFGDEGVGYHGLANDSLLLGQNPAFHLHAGDIAYADPSGSGKTSDTGFDSRCGTSSSPRPSPSPSPCRGCAPTATTTWRPGTRRTATAARSPLEPARQRAGQEEPAGRLLLRLRQHGGHLARRQRHLLEIPANLGISGGTQTKWFEAQLKKYRPSDDMTRRRVLPHCAYCTSTAHASGRAGDRSGCGCREVRGGPGHQRPQPPVRAQGRHQGGQGRQEAAVGDTAYPRPRASCT